MLSCRAVFSLRLMFWFYVVLLWLCACDGKTQLPKNLNIKAVFVFGDSIVDQGNNNNITTLIKCNFPPYGKDFIDGKPTGRFTNAKTPADLIVEELGIKELMPAYLDPKLQAEDLKTGVSFASGACGYDPQTAAIASVIPLSTQLNHFQEYVGKLKGLVGEEEANTILRSSLYFVVAGSNDLANTYFTIGLRRKQYDINSYTDLMVDGAADFIQELYKLGARKIGVFGIPPVGCLPFQRTVSGGIFRMCVEEYNEAAQLVNTKLAAAINDSLSKKLPQSKLVFIDLYDPMLDLIVNPKKYGFEVVEKGCCGTGNIEVLMLCKYGGTCEDDTKYLFWDSYHPTERGYRILVDQMMKKGEDSVLSLHNIFKYRISRQREAKSSADVCNELLAYSLVYAVATHVASERNSAEFSTLREASSMTFLHIFCAVALH